MNIEEVRIPVKAVEKVCSILVTNYGNPNFKTLSNANLELFIATAIEAAYRVGYLDGQAVKAGTAS